MLKVLESLILLMRNTQISVHAIFFLSPLCQRSWWVYVGELWSINFYLNCFFCISFSSNLLWMMWETGYKVTEQDFEYLRKLC